MIEVAYRQQNKNDSTHPSSFVRSPVTAHPEPTSAPASASAHPALPSAAAKAPPRTTDHSPYASLSDLSAAPLQIKPLRAPPSPLVSQAPAVPYFAQPNQRQAQRPTTDLQKNGLGLATGELSPTHQSASSVIDLISAKPGLSAHSPTSSAPLPPRTMTANASQVPSQKNAAASARRIRRGQKLEEIQSLNVSEPPLLQQIDSPFQLQEYLALLVRQNPHDVEHIVRLPQATVAPLETFDGSSSKGKSKEVDGNGDVFMGHANGGGEEEVHMVDTDVWVYEQLRRIVTDFTTPWLTALQRDCDRKQRPATCDAMNADDWMYLCASHGEEKQCCAIDYIIHTLDGTTALLNSHRHFPSRTYIPTTSLRHFGSVSRRLSRIFVHAYEHHREVFEACEVETSLYARFLALVEAYDLIAIDALPKLGAKRVTDTKATPEVTKATTLEDVPRGTTAVHRSLFDSGDVGGVPSDETGEDEDEVDDDEDEADEPLSSEPVSVGRSDSNASRITAIRVGGIARNGDEGQSTESAAADETVTGS